MHDQSLLVNFCFLAVGQPIIGLANWAARICIMLVRVSTIKNLVSYNSNSANEIHSFSLNSRRRNHCYVVRYDFDSFASILFNDNSLQGVNMAFRPGDTFDTYTDLCSCQWTFFVDSKTGFSCEGKTLALTVVAFLPNVISATSNF